MCYYRLAGLNTFDLSALWYCSFCETLRIWEICCAILQLIYCWLVPLASFRPYFVLHEYSYFFVDTRLNVLLSIVLTIIYPERSFEMTDGSVWLNEGVQMSTIQYIWAQIGCYYVTLQVHCIVKKITSLGNWTHANSFFLLYILSNLRAHRLYLCETMTVWPGVSIMWLRVMSPR